MQIRLGLFFSFIFCLFAGNAQQTPSEIKYKAWDIHALRYYPFTQRADSFMERVIDQKHVPTGETFTSHYEKLAVDWVMNKQFLANITNNQDLLSKLGLLHYSDWFAYARPVREDARDLNLPLFLSECYSKENRQAHSSVQSPLEWIGTENIRYCLEEWLGEIDIWKERNEVLFSSVQSPLAKNAGKIYRYFFSSRTEVEGIPVYEIAFFSQKPREKAFEGYLYISVNDLSPVKAVFTLNPLVKKAPAKSVLFIQTPSKKETLLSIGDDITTGLLIEQVSVRGNKSADSIPPDFLTPAQKEISGLVEETRNTRAYSNLQNGLSFLFTDHIGIFRNRFDLGPVTQMLSYNFMEGIRIRTGGFTSQKISKQAAVGGYLAYGTKDRRWKYRGDIIYYPRLKDQIQLTYVNDLNIPGYDCLEDKRDRIFYSLYKTHTTNMSLQKIGQLSYETDGFRGFSFKLHTKYTHDQYLGVVMYETVKDGVQTAIHDITTSEFGASFRFSPKERHLRIKGKRIVFRSPDVDFRLNHRIGVKGILGSDFNYHITDVNLSKTFDFPVNTGSLDIRFSGGKVWNSVPFPLLFIPSGNQSYVYEANDYNLMRFYEFVTDRFVAGNIDIHLNVSPIKWIFPKSKMKMHGGIKAIYGPISDKNNPQLHPDLFVFNQGTESLGEKPYAEAHIGLSGILKYLRVDYVYRLTYRDKGSLFISTVFNL